MSFRNSRLIATLILQLTAGENSTFANFFQNGLYRKTTFKRDNIYIDRKPLGLGQ